MGDFGFDIQQIRNVVPEHLDPSFPIFQLLQQEVGLAKANHELTENDLDSFGKKIAHELISSSSNHSEETIRHINEDSLERMKSEYGIDFDQEITKTRMAILRAVDSLGISEEAKLFIRGTLDQTEVYARGRSVQLQGSSEESPKNTIIMSPALTLGVASRIARLNHVELTGDLIRGIIVKETAHECGHVVDLILQGNSLSEKSASGVFADKFMDSFPIKYPQDDIDALGIRDQFETMKKERFAGFFVTDLLKGLGISTMINRDEGRIDVANIYNTGLNPFELLSVFNASIKELQSMENNHQVQYALAVVVHHELEDILSNTPLAELFPFQQQEVEEIINNAWLARMDQEKVVNKTDIKETPEPLSGKETAKLVESLYEIAGPRIGSILVESNIVLTLAGARGQTEFFINYPIEADKEIISKLNDALSEKGIQIRTIGDIEERTDRPDYLMVSIDNLRGYERISRMTSIPGVKPFDSKSGWKGFQTWSRECVAGIEEARKQGKIPFPEQIISSILSGIYKGYPDIAIFDEMEWVTQHKLYRIAEATVPYTDLYGGAIPSFDIHPNHADDPSVTQIVDAWGQILEDFYASPWHQQIKQDKQFLEAREFNE